FKPFFSWLQKRGYVGCNPFADLRVTVDEEMRTTFNAKELGRLMNIANEIERLQIAFGLLGCRRGEVLNLQVRDVRLDDIPHAVIVHKEPSANTWAWGSKNHRVRYIGLPETMAFNGLVYEFHLAIRTRIVQLGRHPEGYVCVRDRYVAKLLQWQKDGTLTYERRKDPTGNHPRFFKQLQRRAGILEPRRFHELRAAFTTSQLDAGMDIGRVAKLVGHASVNQTKHYDRKSNLSLVAEAARVASKSYVTKVP
ncbi:MAG TPA: site-specific integrase, partial [Sedimentisphaerales bacterium]|nr:site-specific integrase [Sedimentisphaerales bacterium]